MVNHEFELAPTSAPELSVPAPDWFRWAVDQPVQSCRVEVTGCSIHYLHWPSPSSKKSAPGLLFLHGGGAHANWWRFIAPFFAHDYRVAAMDLSGMGDSGAREQYSATIRSDEIDGVLNGAGFFDEDAPKPIVVGHSFGGLTAMRYASSKPDALGGFAIVESPVRSVEREQEHLASRIDVEPIRRIYDSFDDALARFRLRPRQSCVNDFIVEFIGRQSIRQIDEGWTWKFDPIALSNNRHDEPFRDYLGRVCCRTAFIFGDKSALCTSEVLDYTRTLMKPSTPFVGVPEGQHHVTLDQPLAFIAALRGVLEGWRIGGV